MSEYTAKDMRIVADNMLDVFVNGDYSRSDVCAMLRYAADIVERCDMQKNHLDGLLGDKDYELAGVTLRQVINTEKSIVDYILRGDAGKEGK